MNKSWTRRIIAIMYATVGAIVLGYLALHEVSVAFVALNSIVCLIMGFYFGTKATQI